MNSSKKEFPYLGFGLGLRSDHYDFILENEPKVDWFEIISEDFMIPGGQAYSYLDRIREIYPIIMHGVSLSIGSAEPLNQDYLKQLKATIARIDPVWVSDHLCWTGIHGINNHDLLPVPYTQQALEHIVARVGQVQDYLGRQILLENPSSYVSFKESNYSEWDFMSQLAEKADCMILLDVNNIFVSSFNHKFNPYEYIDAIPLDRVQQIHLAGHTHCGDHIIDTHDDAVIPDVWELYAHAIKRFGKVSTMIERDDNIPEFPVLMEELEMAKEISLNEIEQCVA